ncbi:amino acid ABC transporter substrate-binding protein [Saccharopolyspora shandongensis]|uniref:amino acid ABC transporter substrate-binding protein n=1 Tax=Saccharopolyspora shandongensis TaxID=418495 RepID=UPI0033DA0ACA
MVMSATAAGTDAPGEGSTGSDAAHSERAVRYPAANDAHEAITIGVSMSLTGALGLNGRSALLAQKIWVDDINSRGGLLGRPVQLVVYDDRTDGTLVPDIYRRLMDVDEVDLVLGGYGTNTLAPAMPLIAERNRYFVGLMGLGVNTERQYPNYFAMIPTGPDPSSALTEGFFELAAQQVPRPRTVAFISADAEFARNPIIGAAENAEKHGFTVIDEITYSLSTSEFTPIIDSVVGKDPDLLLLCCYLDDSIGLVKALRSSDWVPKMVGGAMTGPQSTAVKSALGPLLNGVVNYEYWLPVPSMMFTGVEALMNTYQLRAQAENADPIGSYMAPQAYAQMQVIEQAVAATGSLDDQALAQYTRTESFDTVVGAVKFGIGGEWEHPRVIQVQYQNVTDAGQEQFKHSHTQVVVAPAGYTSGAFRYPYRAK